LSLKAKLYGRIGFPKLAGEILEEINDISRERDEEGSKNMYLISNAMQGLYE